MSRSHGDGVLFVLDGFDELPVSLQHEFFFIELINKTILPESTVIVTSRPSATAELLTACKPLIWKHIEVLGFTQESVKAYAASIFSDPRELENFMSYISASKNPAINSLMYVPINAAIIVQIYSQNKSKTALPSNLTQLYTQLCLTILSKYMKIENPSVRILKFRDLPDDLYQQFVDLSSIAFEGIKNQQVILHNDSDFCHFGFLDAVSTLYGGGEISYNFLHLTLQEFFAAYYISQVSDCGVALFESYGSDRRWNVVWQFAAGLTKFHCFDTHTSNDAFLVRIFGEDLGFGKFFICCLFEARVSLDFKSTFGTETCKFHCNDFQSALERFALGYCIRNCSTKASFWSIYGVQSIEFYRGLMTEHVSDAECGVIVNLSFNSSPYIVSDIESLWACVHSYPREIQLHLPLINVVDLTIRVYEVDNFVLHFIDLIPHLNFQNLVIDRHYENRCGKLYGVHLLLLFQQLRHSTITTLQVQGTLTECFLKQSVPFASALSALIHSGTLHKLIISADDTEYCSPVLNIGNFVGLVSLPSSLQTLVIQHSSLATFSTDNNLTNLTIISNSTCWSDLLKDIIRIIFQSSKLEHLHLGVFRGRNIDLLRVIVTAILVNRTLQTLKLYVLNEREMLQVTLQQIDSRVTVYKSPADWIYSLQK